MKMKGCEFFVSLALIATVNVGCGPIAMDYQITFDIVNEADHPIGYYIADGYPSGICNPDSLPETDDRVVYDTGKELKSGVLAHYRTWERYFEGLPCDTLSIFIFHTDTLNKYSWEEVRKGNMFLRRYDLGVEDVKRMGELVYP